MDDNANQTGRQRFSDLRIESAIALAACARGRLGHESSGAALTHPCSFNRTVKPICGWNGSNPTREICSTPTTLRARLLKPETTERPTLNSTPALRSSAIEQAGTSLVELDLQAELRLDDLPQRAGR
jgi:hypothetical protein